MELLERYNLVLQSAETETIERLNKIIDASFNRLIRRVYVHLRTIGKENIALRNVLILQELRQLIPATRPGKVGKYEKLFQTLYIRATTLGVDAASQLSTQAGLVSPEGGVGTAIPIEAVKAAIEQTRTLLTKRSLEFANKASDLIAQGILEGRDIATTTNDVRTALNTTKSAASTIVRTETLRAYNSASNSYYIQNNIKEVMWYATADSRTCKLCAPRAGRIYPIGTVSAPLHPRCRCYLAPWNSELIEENSNYNKSRLKHAKEVRFAEDSAEILNVRGILISI